MLKKLVVMLMVCVLLVSTGSVLQAKDSKEEQQAKIRENAQKTLDGLYKINLRAKAAVEKAVGYAIFNNFGMKILVAGGGSGKGLAVTNKTKKEVFMKMAEIQAGLGFGAKKFSPVWFFNSQKALDQFINSGWEAGSQATAAAKTDSKGGSMEEAVPIGTDLWLYQITDAGLAMELTVKGTKYLKDDGLN